MKINKYLVLHFIILLWGFTPVLGKLISLPAIELVWWRLLFSLISLYIYARWKGVSFRISFSKILPLLGWGLVVGGHWYFFYHAIKVSNVSVAMMGFSSITLFASLLQPLLLKKKFFWGDLIYGLVIMIGLLIVSEAESIYLSGIIYGILAAFLGALFGVYNGSLITRYDSAQITLFEFLGAFILMTVVSYYEMMNLNQDFSIFPFSFPGTSDLVFLLILSILCTTLAFTLSVEILKKIDPLTVIITNNLEPIYGVVFSVLLFKDSEIMSGTFYIGAGILLLSIFSYPFIKRKLQQKEKPVEETSLQA